MTAVVGRAWGWVLGSWNSRAVSEKTTVVKAKGQEHGFRGEGLGGWTSWIWGGWRCQSDQSSPVEEYWEAQERLQPMEIEDLGAGRQETDASSEQVSRWWNKYLPTSYFSWPRKTETIGLRRRKCDVQSRDARDCDIDGDFSDYGTPPPSPTPPSSQLTSPFRLFAHSWKVEILPEHYEICFNFLRHLFDLFVVGFLWTVSPPAKLILEVLGVQGALRLWFHGMAMFFVSTVGMAGLLWLIQEYLPQFALIYGIIQALVISVSVRQSVILSIEEEKEENDEGGKETEKMEDCREHKEKVMSINNKVKTS
ncbi:uncharacterized protein C6orf47 homolog [Epinephelus fuscoguttatus]|uniref:uncharacterized protein C6orf47 homolog n=1 Tax=Epinephelus lanceolatus TaxID=310571 RepID=UPI0014460964|nr:uncharacterized protein C6orf47 homolog [Epinephelus lanceolatus]XP_049457583.1 uncharacterized protein C6orf47 homolog [Epinephelus fuscoguttatus]XP_049457584.1 uncharacterized protein C6orf47 homolog [Epinephelus fuscoguttatus]